MAQNEHVARFPRLIIQTIFDRAFSYKMNQEELNEFIEISKAFTSELYIDKRTGRKAWLDKYGKYHRLDGPAVEHTDGRKEWYVLGKRHRLDGPAVEHPDGRKVWWVKDKIHRLGGPAFEHPNGNKEWWVNHEYHRLDGPAVEYTSGYKVWYIYSRCVCFTDPLIKIKLMQRTNRLLKLTVLQNKSRKFNEWLFDPDHYAGKWHKKNMLRDFQDS